VEIPEIADQMIFPNGRPMTVIKKFHSVPSGPQIVYFTLFLGLGLEPSETHCLQACAQ
jgi:hypothetical protein